MFRFDLDTGKQHDNHSNGATHAVVMPLVQPCLKKGYQLFTDNYYTSQALGEALFARQTTIVGAMQVKHVGFPQRLKNPKGMLNL